MRRMRTALALVLLLASTAAWAQKTDGLIVTAGDAEYRFAISEVQELTFGDEGLTLVKTDEATVEFAAGWQIRFGEVDVEDGIPSAGVSNSKAKAQIFNAEGKLVQEVPLRELRLGDLPKGVYIIRYNGKSLKIQR